MSAVPADLRLPQPWRLALPAVLVLLALILLLYRETALAMVDTWGRSETFTHAYLVPPISLWLIWRQRDRLAALAPSAQPWLLLPLLLAAAAWLVADLAVVNAASQFALVALLVLAVPAVLGLEVALTILFPLLFLFFAVPFGEFMLPWMMAWTADFTVAALQFSGIPVYREGLQFIIPSGKWSVVEACSGVRYLIASFMVGTLFAYLNYRSNRRRAIFMVVAILVPIVANWLRAYIIVMLGHLSGNTIAVGVDHLIYGWVFFGIVIMIMFVIGARWAEHDGPQPSHGISARRTQGGMPRLATPGAIGATLLAAFAIAALPQATLHGLQRAEAGAAEPRLVLPAKLASGWSSEGAKTAVWQPRFHAPSAQAAATYATPGGAAVGVYLAYYRGQGPERKLVSSQNMLVASDDLHWNLVGSGRRGVEVGGQPLDVRTAELLGTLDPRTVQRSQLAVWQLYWIDGRWVAGDARAKVYGALARLRGHGDEGAVLVLHTDDESAAAAAATLSVFVTDNLGLLGGLLQRTQDAR